MVAACGQFRARCSGPQHEKHCALPAGASTMAGPPGAVSTLLIGAPEATVSYPTVFCKMGMRNVLPYLLFLNSSCTTV